MTTKTAAEMIEIQNKVLALQKRFREHQADFKSANAELQQLESGKHWACKQDGGKRVPHLVGMYREKLGKAQGAMGELTIKLEALEKQRPLIIELPHHDLLMNFFKGNSFENARNALELVALCLPVDSWVPGAARRVWAGLAVEKAPKKVQAEYKKAAADLLAKFKTWDSTRPVPTFTTMNASPTVSAELKRQGATNVEVCPMKFERIEVRNHAGEFVGYAFVVVLLWPEGTKHHTSSYAYGTGNNRQCHACGHAIKNPMNWVPLILTTEAGEKKSLWVGRDCAETLFGVRMDGDLELAPGQR
jgi:hypothetical protein